MQLLRVDAKRHLRTATSVLAVLACGATARLAHAEDLTEALSLSVDNAVDNGKPFRFVSAMDGESLGIAGGSSDAGQAIVQWGYSKGDANLQWKLQRVAHKKYVIRNVHSNLCMESPASAGWGTAVDQAPCNNTSQQVWTFTPAANGSYYMVNQLNGWCSSVEGANWTPGFRMVFWGCVSGTNQQFRVEPLDTDGAPRFGYRKVHPEKMGFYMIPDFYSVYQTGSAKNGCKWGNVQSSLKRINQLIPQTAIRWDTEVGHVNATDPNASVNATTLNDFLNCTDSTNVEVMVSAAAVPGYNNVFANGGTPVTFGLLDFAGNQNQFGVINAAANAHASVQLIETANEPDTSWFVNDADNVSDFATYLAVLEGKLGTNASKIVGPATASQAGNIWNYYLGTSHNNVSYHTYYGCNTLHDVFGKNVYVTEYGGNNAEPFVSGDGNTTIAYPSPGWLLADMWYTEHDQRLSNSIQKLFYHQLFDDGGNRGVFNYRTMEGNHFAIRDWARALAMYSAAGSVSRNTYLDENTADFMATDDGSGHSAALLWNYSFANYSNVSRQVPGTTVQRGTPLFVAHVLAGDATTFTCVPYSDPRNVWVGADYWDTNGSPSATWLLTVKTLEPHAAVLVTTQDCSSMAN